ncbi:exported hypothetical protein [Xenorhabdus szentirmaii DSM 16338]|uniref:Uncharacterized protein n=1 Tax=Xenorhabdus szentirmaii DSM 16338 TaxID=1427518 RepID=W1J5F5_9GAMM|nr:exported hypothetical protein [Xenorhabdus szentirmaii DSM 16338]
MLSPACWVVTCFFVPASAEVHIAVVGLKTLRFGERSAHAEVIADIGDIQVAPYSCNATG